MIVTLTEQGREVVDAALADLLDREHGLLDHLPAAERETLAQLLRRLLSPFDSSVIR